MTSSHESDVSVGVYKTIDGGQTWNESNKGLRHIETNDIQIDPLNPDVLYLAMDVPRFIQGTLLSCPLHGAVFNLKTGEVMAPPAFEDLQTFKLKIEGTSVSVKNPDT